MIDTPFELDSLVWMILAILSYTLAVIFYLKWRKCERKLKILQKLEMARKI